MGLERARRQLSEGVRSWWEDVLSNFGDAGRKWSDVRDFYREHEWFKSLCQGLIVLVAIVSLDIISGHRVGFRFLFIVPVFVASLRGDWVPSALVTAATFLALMMADFRYGVLVGDEAILSFIVNLVALTATASVIVTLQKKIQQIHHLANHDALTGAMTRAAIQAYADEAIHRAGDPADEVVIGVIDCDGFKEINDLYGHSAGDEVLITLVSTLKRYIGDSGEIGRIGGDEFVLVFEGRSQKFVERLIDRARADYSESTKGITSPRGFSFGCAVLGQDGSSYGSLVQAADDRMYKDKGVESVAMLR